MNQTTHYELLGLTPNCTPQEIKQSYRKLALIWHPDKHDNKIEAQTHFANINEAYNTLSDVTKREIYDTYGQKGLEVGSSASSSRSNFFHKKGFNGTDKTAFDTLKDIFKESDEEPAFKGYDMSDLSNSFKTTFESFMNGNFKSAEDDSTNFLASYKPTFMNDTFSSQFLTLDQLYGNQNSLKKAVYVNPLTNKKSLRLAKDNKRAFLVNDEEEEENQEIKSFFQMNKTKVDRKLSFYSQAFDEREDLQEGRSKSKKTNKRGTYNLESLYQQKGCKKLKTLQSFIQKDELIFNDDELIC